MDTIISIIPENDNQRKLIQYTIQKGEKTLETINKVEGVCLFISSSDRTITDFLEDLCNKIPIKNVLIYEAKRLTPKMSVGQIDFQVTGKDNTGTNNTLPITIYPKVNDFSFQVEGNIEDVGSIFKKIMVEKVGAESQDTENHRSLPIQKYRLNTANLDNAKDDINSGLVDIEVHFKEIRGYDDKLNDIHVIISGFQGLPRMKRGDVETKIKSYFKDISRNHTSWFEQNCNLRKLVATDDSPLISLFNAILSSDGRIDDDNPNSTPESLLLFCNAWGLNKQQLDSDIKKLIDFGIILKDSNGICLNLPGLTIINEQKDDLVTEQIGVPFINGIAREWFQKVLADIRTTSNGDEYLRRLARKHVMFQDELYEIGESISSDEKADIIGKLVKYGIILQKFQSNKHRTFFMSRAVIQLVNS